MCIRDRDRPETPITLRDALAVIWNRLKGNKPQRDMQDYPSALIGTVKVLLEHHADPNVRGIYGYTPLMLAKNMRCARLLIEYGATVSAKDVLGTTALDYANGE